MPAPTLRSLARELGLSRTTVSDALRGSPRVDPRTAERFEAFYLGVELANGYHELCDPEELAGRSELANRQRIADGKFSLPVESPLIDAMRLGIPDSCGCALGFDRVVMLACQSTKLSDVIPFPVDRA